MGLTPYLGEGYEFVSLRAPLAYGPGYSWFGIQLPDAPNAEIKVDCDDAKASLAAVAEFVKSLPRPLYLVGFSQGAMMALGVWLEHGDLVDGVVAMSGGWIPCFNTVNRSDSPVLMTHGDLDPLVPVHFGRESFDRIRQLGAPVEFKSFPMGHEVDEESLGMIRTWLQENVPS